MSEEFSSEEQDRNDEPDKNAAFFPQKLQSSYQNPTQNQMQLFSNLLGTFNDSGSLDTALEALEGMANLHIASPGNDYSVKLKIGDYPVVTGKVEPDVIRPMTGWESFKWDFGKVVPYIPYVNVLNDAKIALTGSDFAGYYASPGEQQDAKFQTVLNVATVGTGGLLGAELKSLRGAAEKIGVVSKGPSNAEAKFAANLEEHLIKTDTRVPRSRGIGGAHNIEEFSKNEVNIVNEVAHPTVDGVKTVEYQITAIDGKTGGVIGWKSQVYKKTVYDPQKISDQQFVQWGKEAANEAANAGSLIGREWTGTASNGLKFRGYLNEAGEVTSFYPDF